MVSRISTKPVDVRVFICFAATLGLLFAIHVPLMAMEVKLNAQKLTDLSDQIIEGKVVTQQSVVREDAKGKHIYTQVAISPIQSLKGKDLPTTETITIEVIGGTFKGWREEVSYSPSFENAEQCVLFLKSKPFKIVGGRQGKRVVKEGKFVIDEYRMTPKQFKGALDKFNKSKFSGATLQSYMAESGENLRSKRQNLTPVHSQDVASSGTINRNGSPKDLGGGQLPVSEIPTLRK